jgi:hypothetical protein
MTTLPPAKKRNPRIEDFHFPDGLPTANELPYSDDAPVDSELQELMPGVKCSCMVKSIVKLTSA